jgi:hypothetical protein
VQRVHIDGLQRTKNDIVIHHVKPLFEAKNFEEVIYFLCVFHAVYLTQRPH